MQKEIIEHKQIQEADQKLWAEIFRMLDCARTEPEEELLEALLNGRPAEIDTVRAISRLAATHFELDVKDRIINVCQKFLGPEYLKKSLTTSRRGILDELADDNIRITGKPDEFLEGLRTKPEEEKL
jgi:hypothetical protein